MSCQVRIAEAVGSQGCHTKASWVLMYPWMADGRTAFQVLWGCTKSARNLIWSLDMSVCCS